MEENISKTKKHIKFNIKTDLTNVKHANHIQMYADFVIY